jgi:hypothetical protein
MADRFPRRKFRGLRINRQNISSTSKSAGLCPCFENGYSSGGGFVVIDDRRGALKERSPLIYVYDDLTTP